MMTPSPKAPGLWRGISCNEIDKYPVADEKRCIGFGRCFLTCGKEVYQVDWDKKKSVVVHPNQCLDGCKTCPHLCPSEVIRFARRRYTRKAKAQRLIERRKILPAFKKELNDDEELTNER